jgi:hypothetical protein
VFAWHSTGWVEHFAKPIIFAVRLMGIASLDPSYALDRLSALRQAFAGELR